MSSFNFFSLVNFPFGYCHSGIAPQHSYGTNVPKTRYYSYLLHSSARLMCQRRDRDRSFRGVRDSSVERISAASQRARGEKARRRRSPDERDEAVDPWQELEVYTPNKLL